MNSRKIQVVLAAAHQFVKVGRSRNERYTFHSLTDFMGVGNKVKFARRPFAGAKRETFRLTDDFSFEGNTTKVMLCISACQDVLGVGNRTKKFTVWYKRI